MSASLEFFVRAILQVSDKGTKKLKTFQDLAESASAKLVASSNKITAANLKAMSSFSKLAAGIGSAAAVAIGVGAAKGGLEFNTQMEGMQNQIGTTLRLFDHISPGIEEGASAAEKFKANLAEADTITKDLVKVANESPGGFLEVAELFKSMLASSKAAGQSMDDIMRLTQQTTLAAGATGEAFDEAGRDMSRMISGAAGMDVKMWRTLAPVLVEAARESDELSGKFKELRVGDAFTKDFNKALTSAERFKLLLAATGKMGPEVAEHFANSWDGASSTAISAVKMLQGEVMKGPFEALKSAFVRATTEGFLGGDRMDRLKQAAQFLSDRLQPITERFLDAVVRGGNYLADNWEHVFTKIRDAFTTGIAAAKLYLAAKAVRNVGAAAISGGAGVAKAAGTARMVFPIIVKFVMMLAAMAPAFLGFLPVIAAIGLAVGFVAFAFIGAAAVIAGFAAYFLSSWDAIMLAFSNGTIALGPLMGAVDNLFAKLAALGQSLFGGASAVSIVDMAVQMLTRGIEIMTGIISIGLRAWAAVHNAFNIVTASVKVLGVGLLAMIATVMEAVKKAISYLPGTEGVLSSIQSGLNGIYKTADSLTASARKDVTTDLSRPWEAAQAFDDAFAKAGQGITAKLAEAITSGPGGGGGAAGGALAAQGGALKRPAETQINVHNMNVYNDLRNEDPDRIAGAFVEQIQRRVERPTQAVTLEDYGI